MSKPKWKQALEANEKMAVALKTDEEGNTRVVAAGTGAEADKIVAAAQAHGVEVQRDPENVEKLLRAEDDGTSVPPEVYELMAVAINFVQEVDEQWAQERLDPDY